MKNLFQLLLLLALLVASDLMANAPEDRHAWDFSVFLDDRKIGFHRFERRGDPERHEVSSEASFDVRFLFLNAFSYRHNNNEVWDGGCLERIESSTQQNGDRQSVTGTRDENGFILDTGNTQRSLDECVMTFAYWNPDFLEQQRLLNPQTGEYLPIEVQALGLRSLTVRGKAVPATGYRVVAKGTELTVWYSENLEWLGLESKAKGGRVIRYELT